MTTPSGFLFRPLVRSLAFGLLLAAGLASAQPASIVEDDEIEVSDELSAEGLPALPEKPSKTLRFGYFESAPTRMRERLLEPTVEALRKAFPDLKVELVETSEFALQLGVVERKFDLFLISSGYYTYLTDAGSGAIWLATRKSPVTTSALKGVGSVFVVRAEDEKFQEISDLRTARVAATGHYSFGGWLTALAEVANITQYPENFFGKTFFPGGPSEKVIDLLREGRVEAGVLTTCDLEAMQLSGDVRPDEFRVIGERQVEGYACRTSTKLYPDTVLAARADLPDEWAKRIASVVLAMATTHDGWGWSAANQFLESRRTVHRFAGVMTSAQTDDAATERYQYALLIGFLILAGSVGYNVLVSRVVANRTKALVRIIDEKTELEESNRENRSRLSQLERAGIVSELSSMIAHELRQPVSALINYADGLQLYLGGKGKDPMVEEATREIAREAERVSDIVERVRRYAKQKSQVHAPIDLCEVTKRAFTTFRSSTDQTGVRITSEFVESAPIEGDPLELELLVVNLLKNALHAAQRSPEGKGRIAIRIFADGVLSDDPRWVLEIRDNGAPVSDESFENLAHPISSDKLEGLGLGLSICRVIAERHAAKLLFRRLEPCGLCAALSFAQRRDVPQAPLGDD